MNPNLKAFLDTIAVSEGTYGLGDDGYNVLVGCTKDHLKLFSSYEDHPRVVIDLGKGLKSTAAGRYQELAHNFDFYKKLLKLSDFSPSSQDAIAIQQIKEQHALDLITLGYFDAAIKNCANIWASFPNAGYEQQEHPIEKLRTVYIKMGGILV